LTAAGTTTDGTEIFYKDWGSGQPIVFSHGWPLSSDDWDAQLMLFLARGYRVVASDRRGQGRSAQVADGRDMDHYADDLAAVVEHLDLHDAVHVGHSTGGGEVARYLARHGESRVAKAALIAEDLKQITVPVLVMHSEDDQIVPYADSGPLTAALLKNGTLKTYQGFPHGMPTTEAATINADLLAFIRK
jgi:non-heme chloroperoxidase